MAYLPYDAHSLGTGVYSIRCQHCSRQVATMSEKELMPFMLWLTVTSEVVSCFDCDSVGADVVPPVLDYDDTLWIDDQPFNPPYPTNPLQDVLV